MKTPIAKLLIFLFTVLLMGIMGGLYSLIFAGIAGGSAVRFAPRFSFELVGRYICPADSQLQYDSVQDPPAGASYSVNCVAQDGTVTRGMKTKAISTVVGMYFLVCFIPTYLPGAILLWILLNSRFFHFLENHPDAPNDKEILDANDED